MIAADKSSRRYPLTLTALKKRSGPPPLTHPAFPELLAHQRKLWCYGDRRRVGYTAVHTILRGKVSLLVRPAMLLDQYKSGQKVH